MIEYFNELSTQDQERLQNMIRLLLDQTFLLERKYDKKTGRMMADRDFYFCDQHMGFLKDYFAVAGLELNQSLELGTISLTGGNRFASRLSKLATIYILILKLIYDEKLSQASTSATIFTTFGELNEKIGEFNLLQSISSVTEIKQTFRVLKKYQMVEITDTFEELSEMTRIIINPCISLILMREDMIALLSSFQGEEETGGKSEAGI